MCRVHIACVGVGTVSGDVLRKDNIHGQLSKELENALKELGATDFAVTNLTTRPTKEGPKPIDHDSDPTTIFVDYKSIYPSESADAIERRIKIEISCLSMAEPFELKRISSMISETFPEADDTFCDIRTVTPSRTFLEKILLLNEELQKDKPRTKRMSRHLYDIEKLMDTDYGKAAIENRDLFTTIIEHRRKFYHLGYVDYDKDYPEFIDFCPSGLLLTLFAEDYNASMTHSYIYGTALPFDTIMERLRDLQERIRQM